MAKIPDFASLHPGYGGNAVTRLPCQGMAQPIFQTA
jgi:hypothetical protein